VGGFPGVMLDVVHRRMRRAVGAYLDGELSPPEAAVVAAHLDECWGCSGDAEMLRLIKRSLQRLAARRPTDLVLVRLRRWADGLIT
jgi:anti-sigma factor RsiW